MLDKFGNPLNTGDHVIYFTSDIAKEPRVGYILAENGSLVTLQTRANREISRLASQVILYVGIVT